MYSFIKRLFDFIAAIIALFILSPFFVIIVLILLLTGEHKVFYYQQRVGYLNKPFSIIKFATMLQNSPFIGTGSITVRNDPRVLPFGSFLRKTKINELPQLINVVIGEMSFVGPRPQMQADLFKFADEAIESMYKSKPGITGIGSVVFRDEEKWISSHNGDKHEYYKNYIAPYKGSLELWYLDNKNFYIDFCILFSTGWVILFPKSNIIFKLMPNTLPPRPSHLN